MFTGVKCKDETKCIIIFFLLKDKQLHQSLLIHKNMKAKIFLQQHSVSRFTHFTTAKSRKITTLKSTLKHRPIILIFYQNEPRSMAVLLFSIWVDLMVVGAASG
jgi:hypothetical protein